jgi:hypothetical protein
MKVGIQGNNDRAIGDGLRKDLLVLGSLHSELRNMMANVTESPKKRRAISCDSLVKQKLQAPGLHYGDRRRLRLVREIGRREFKRLADIVLFEVRIVPEQIVAIRIDSDC